MQYVGKVLSGFYKDISINPSTLSGAIDVLVVEDVNTGQLACSPFHVRFGKLQLLRPQDKVVSIVINDKPVEDLKMKVGEAGEVFWVLPVVLEDGEEAPPPEYLTSPLMSTIQVPQGTTVPSLSLSPSKHTATNKSDPEFGGADTTANANTASSSATTLSGVQSDSEIEYRGKSSSGSRTLSSTTNTTINNNTCTSPSKYSWMWGTLPERQDKAKKSMAVDGRLSGNGNGNGHDDDDDDDDCDILHIPPDSIITLKIEVPGQAMEEDWLSFIQQHPTIPTSINGNDVMASIFSRSPLDSQNACFLGRVKLSIAISMLIERSSTTSPTCSNCSSPTSSMMASASTDSLLSKNIIAATATATATPNTFLKTPNHPPSPSSWRFWSSPSASASTSNASLVASAATAPKHKEDLREAVAILARNATDSNFSNNFSTNRTGLQIPEDLSSLSLPASASASASILQQQPPSPPPKKLTENNDTFYTKSLRLPNEMLKKLPLVEGANNITFSVSTKLQGTAVCSARIFKWKSNSKIIVSDVDGTITKSDALGHLFTMMGQDWTQAGIAKLYTAVARNDYKFIYLTCRSLGQATGTRLYLRGVDQDKDRLPDGPVIMSPDRLLAALRREVVKGNPEKFKIACLKDLLTLFNPGFSFEDDFYGGVGVSGSSGCSVGSGVSNNNTNTNSNAKEIPNPFFAGFGNKSTDALSYLMVGIPPQRIFIVNPEGCLTVEPLGDHYESSYELLLPLVDSIFPPVNGGNGGGSSITTDSHSQQTGSEEPYNDFWYWRRPTSLAPLLEGSNAAPLLLGGSGGGNDITSITTTTTTLTPTQSSKTQTKTQKSKLTTKKAAKSATAAVADLAVKTDTNDEQEKNSDNSDFEILPKKSSLKLKEQEEEFVIDDDFYDYEEEEDDDGDEPPPYYI